MFCLEFIEQIRIDFGNRTVHHIHNQFMLINTNSIQIQMLHDLFLVLFFQKFCYFDFTDIIRIDTSETLSEKDTFNTFCHIGVDS